MKAIVYACKIAVAFMMIFMAQRVEAFIILKTNLQKYIRGITIISMLVGQAGAAISLGNALRQLRYLALENPIVMPDFDYRFPYEDLGNKLYYSAVPVRMILEISTLILSVTSIFRQKKDLKDHVVKILSNNTIRSMLFVTLIDCVIKIGTVVMLGTYKYKLDRLKLLNNPYDIEITMTLYSIMSFGTNIQTLFNDANSSLKLSGTMDKSKQSALTDSIISKTDNGEVSSN